MDFVNYGPNLTSGCRGAWLLTNMMKTEKLSTSLPPRTIRRLKLLAAYEEKPINELLELGVEALISQRALPGSDVRALLDVVDKAC